MDPRGQYLNPALPGGMGIQNAVPSTDLDSPEVQAAVAELYDQVFGTSRDDATSKPRPRPGPGHPAGSKQVQRRLPPEEVEELIASYRAGATALVLAGKALDSPDDCLGTSRAPWGVQTRACS